MKWDLIPEKIRHPWLKLTNQRKRRNMISRLSESESNLTWAHHVPNQKRKKVKITTGMFPTLKRRNLSQTNLYMPQKRSNPPSQFHKWTKKSTKTAFIIRLINKNW